MHSDVLSEHPYSPRCACPACMGYQNGTLKQTDQTYQFIDKYFDVQETLNARGSRYGDFTDNAKISQQLQRILKNSPSFPFMSEVQIEGMTAVMQKIARILNGDPNYADNWHDIQGYARLVEERLPKETKS